MQIRLTFPRAVPGPSSLSEGCLLRTGEEEGGGDVRNKHQADDPDEKQDRETEADRTAKEGADELARGPTHRAAPVRR